VSYFNERFVTLREKSVELINIIKIIIRHPLNKSKRIVAIIDFIRWQIGSRLISGSVIFDWVNGSKLIARTGETGATGNIYLGLHEFPDMAFLLHALRKDDLFVDIGANIGSYTVLASAVIGSRTICFEPVPSTYERLMANIRINNIERKVLPLNIALGNSKGETHFSSDKNCKNHVIADKEKVKNKITVNLSTLDDELKDCPFLIKIDIEGYEKPALEGAKNTLANDKLCCLIMELNGSGDMYGYDESKILGMMFDYGFKAYTYNPLKRELVELSNKNTNEGNTIFIRNIKFVEDRIERAPIIKIFNSEI
jgi:FkbM family methyltransferase